jgi:predicted  nucleic acid-binding Zn-ribbon protein
MNNLNEIITEIKEGQKAKEEITKIKETLNNDGTMSVIDQVAHLQENTSVNNITLLTSKLTRLQDTLRNIENGYDDLVSALDSAKNELEVDCYGEDDIVSLNREIEDLKDDIADNNSELNDDRPQTQVIQERIAKENEEMSEERVLKTPAKKTTFKPTTQQ